MMSAACELSHFSKTKFDEQGRQRSLERLKVVGSEVETPFEQIIDLVKTTLNAPVCAVSLIDKDRQWFKAARGLRVDQTPRNIAICDHAILAEEPFIIEDATLDPRFADNPLVRGDPFIRAYLGIPLKMSDGYIVGTLCVIFKEPRSFSEHEIAILESFANLVVGELELRTIAFTDGLTNLMSRKAWIDHVQAEIDRAARYSTTLSVILLDLDHFKMINDTFGHDVGDLVLQNTAERVNSVLRKHDLVGRLGGEEFAICVLHASEHVGLAVAERIRTQIEAMNFPGYEGLQCSVSIGVAVFDPAKNVDDLLKMADLGLYEAKRSGRNQVRLGSDLAPDCQSKPVVPRKVEAVLSVS